MLKRHLKMLRFVRRRKAVPAAEMYSLFGYDEVINLIRAGYLHCPADPRRQDEEGYTIGEFLPSSPICLTNKGLAEVESNDWFDLRYVVTMIIIPVIIGVASAVITNLIMSLL